MVRHLYIVLFILGLCIPFAVTANDNHPNFTAEDLYLARKIFYFVDKDRWDDAIYLAKKASDPTILPLVRWIHYRTGDNTKFSDIAAFLLQYPHWPSQRRLQYQAEQSLTDDDISDGLITWFSLYPPVSAKGKQYFAAAKLMTIRQGKSNPIEQEKALKLLRESWIEGNFSKKDEKNFLQEYGMYLTQTDHTKRINRLLWDDRINQSKRILKKVSKPYRLLFDARIRLKRNMRGVDQALASVPVELKQDSGLIYDRIKWRERRGRHDGVRELLMNLPNNTDLHDLPLWWKVRYRQVRKLLSEKKYQQAYDLCQSHQQIKSINFAEAEWTAGWIALQFLDLPDIAYGHFKALYEKVRYPISLSRGAYWAGRAAEKQHQFSLAESWYQRAHIFPTTYYGQLATLRIDEAQQLSLPDTPTPSNSALRKYKKNPFIKAAYLLTRMEYYTLAKKFLIQAMDQAKNLEEMILISEFGFHHNRFELSLAGTKWAEKKGIILKHSHYPVLTDLPNKGIEASLILSVIRQESHFRKDAFSSAGAQGMMQLTTSTARAVARRSRMPFSKRRLSTDAVYNVTLGTTYLRDLVKKYDGSYILALAAYNAGPGNVKKWLKRYGDPRKASNIDEVIDWIESIPFSETRNYVQRILESNQMYRLLTKNLPSIPVVHLKNDLKSIN